MIKRCEIIIVCELFAVLLCEERIYNRSSFRGAQRMYSGHFVQIAY